MNPLDGITVVDFTHGVAGPYATMILADLGCDVIKIEKPHRGDPTRYMNVSKKFSSDIPASGGDYFMAINRNKRSVTLDLKDATARSIARDLAVKADVVVQSFRPGVMERLGLGEAELRPENPTMVYGSLSAYGDRGPLAHQPGMDVAVQARSGVMSITGPVGGSEPLKPGVSLADFAGGTHLALGIVAALYRRRITGEGDSVRMSLLDSTMAMLINYSVAVLDGDADLKPMGSGHPQLAPFEAIRTLDGFLVLAPGTNRLFRELCIVLEREDLAVDERFGSNERRVLHRPALLAELEKSFAQRTTADWLEILEREQIPCAPVHTMAEAYRSEQLHANGMVQRVPHPTVGEVSQLSSPYHFGHGDLPIRMAPPLLGQHTDEVLRELLELSPESLKGLHESGAI